MKKTRLLSLILAFLLMLSSVGVFAEETATQQQQEQQDQQEQQNQQQQQIVTLRDNIAAALTDTEDGWSVVDMAAYESLSDGRYEMDNATKLSVVNSYIEEASGEAATASDRARIEIVLSALGVDTTELYAIGEDCAIDNAALTNSSDHTASGHYSVPWVLLSNLQGNVNLSDSQIDGLIDTLSANAGDGTFGYEWDGVTYADADTSGAVLAAIAPFYGTNGDATALVDTVLAGLKTAISDGGSFGSANSDAMVITGLVALGENPYEFCHETSGKSVVDGLLSYANEANSGFTFYGSENALATEQGFRALVALSKYDGAAYNIYDFSDVEKSPASQTVNSEIITLRDNIANVVKDVEDGWSAFDIAAYSALCDAAYSMSDATKQTIINDYIDEAASDTATAYDRARIEIVLRSLGVDSTQLYTINSNTEINNAQSLKEADFTASGHYAAPWVLLANLQGNLNLTDEQIAALITLLEQNSANGTFGYEWDGVQYPNPDTAAAVLAALAPLYDTNAQAKALCDEILAAFAAMINETGSFGSANSDAMVIIGLTAMGKNPAELKHATTKKSVIDGLLSYVNEANNGFTFGGAENYLATEQGLRALVALCAYAGEAYNIYNFGNAEVTPGRQENAESITPSLPSPDASQITVTITIKADTQFWVNNMSVKIPQGGTVYDAFVKVIEAKNMTAVGAEKGYIRSITKNGVTLTEFDKGKNSGWLYKVNGEKPSVGLTDYVLDSKDNIVWYYTEDWTIGGSIVGGGGSVSSKPEEPDKEPAETPEEPEITPVPEFSDVENHWAKEGISYVSALGIMNGVAEGEFAPDEKLTRGMLVTMLYRLSGDEAAGENEFSDVASDAWYCEAAGWAAKAGITAGYGDGTFGADDEVTREQLVVFLMRYVSYMKIETQEADDTFADNDEISHWALLAAAWAKSAGLVSGREDGSFDPKNSATRGEIATVFMRFCENILK